MIEFEQDPQQTIPASSVKIVGLGGAGANMLDRVALDGMEGAEILALNTDIRTLSASVAREKIQLGRNLTKGLGTGGDPELGRQATLEEEALIRDALRERRIVFLCVGLGGGTGSGGAPVVARMAREEGAFVVVFATMPFSFEGRRRREQAEAALNQLAVLSNALVTFDNGRMGELVLAKQGVHEAFAAADRMISESIKAVTRLVVRPGLVNIGLDDLMSALRTTRSRCLFGSGSAEGKDRATRALRNALASPLLDQGALLREAETVLVHLCGGEDLTLYEIELMMQRLTKHVPDSAHVLFGAAVDPALGESLSVTLISALPEERLVERGAAEAGAGMAEEEAIKPSEGFEYVAEEPAMQAAEEPQVEASFEAVEPESVEEPDEKPARKPDPFEAFSIPGDAGEEDAGSMPGAFESEEDDDEEESEEAGTVGNLPFAEVLARFEEESERAAAEAGSEAAGEDAERLGPEAFDLDEDIEPDLDPRPIELRPKRATTQSELTFEGGPTGRFAGETPNVYEGENLDIPSFLRRKKG